MFNSDWYNSLTKPDFAPPDWIFAPMWSILYVLMFISFIIYLTRKAPDKKIGYFYFFTQLILNLIWTPAFFYLKSPLLAFFVIAAMDIFVILTIRKFYSISKLSALLLIPYLLWILFATYLNLGYFLLN